MLHEVSVMLYHVLLKVKLK